MSRGTRKTPEAMPMVVSASRVKANCRLRAARTESTSGRAMISRSASRLSPERITQSPGVMLSALATSSVAAPNRAEKLPDTGMEGRFEMGIEESAWAACAAKTSAESVRSVCAESATTAVAATISSMAAMAGTAEGAAMSALG